MTKAELLLEFEKLKKENDYLKAIIGYDESALQPEMENLKENKKRLHKLFSSFTSIAVQGYSPDGTVKYWNSASEKLYGYTESEAIGKNLIDLIIPSEMHWEIKNAIKQMSETEQPLPSSELSLMRKDGSHVSVYSSHAVFKNPGGKVILYCLDFDLTERIKIEEENRRINNFLNTIIDNIPLTVFLKDAKELRFTLFNKAGENMTGVPRQALLGKNDYDFAPKEQADFFTAKDRAALKNRKILEIDEEPLKTPDGGERILRTKKVPILDINGEPEFLLGISEDITEYKKAEKALKHSEEKYRQLFEAVSDSLFLIDDENGQIYEANSAAVNTYGYSHEELISKHNYDLSAEPDKTRDATEKRANYIPVRYHRKKEGSVFPVEISASHLEWKGKPVHIAAIRDITERLNSEDMLRVSEARFRAFMENMPGLVVIKDNDLRPVFFNKKFLEYFPGDNWLGKTPAEIFPKETAETMIENDRKALQGEIVIYEEEWNQKDGKPIILETKKFAIDTGNESPMLGAIITDITERKHAESIIKQQNEKLQEMNAAKDKLFSIISHDLRSPFQGFIGLTEIILDDINEFSLDELKKLIREIYDGAGNLYKLLNNLLDWAKVQIGATTFHPSTLDLVNVLKSNILFIKQRLEQKDIQLSIDIPDGQKIFADEILIDTILRNIISNAVKYSSRGGKISVSSSVDDHGMVRIAVSDQGIGIPDELGDRLFKIDESVSRKGTEGEASTGLGLLLCKEFVERLGGKIWFDSRAGHGSTFYFTVPSAGSVNKTESIK